jgi:hypothetical protein
LLRPNLYPGDYRDLAHRRRRLQHGFISDIDRTKLPEVAADFDKRADELESQLTNAATQMAD